VGGGGGSIASWLCELVGPTGGVLATDINTRFLQNIKHANFESREHDILKDPLPGLGSILSIHAGCSIISRIPVLQSAA